MGTTPSKHPDDHKYEEPVEGKYKYLGEKWMEIDRPRRIMKNPDVPPCVRGQCEDPVQYLEFKEWMTKEWAVYCAQIKWMQSEIDKCYQKHGQESERFCGDLIREYMNTVDDRNLKEAKSKLWRGEKLVE